MSRLSLLGNWAAMPPSKEGRTRHAGAEPTQKLGLLPNCPREALGAGLEEPLNWLETLRPSGQGGRLEVHWALPTGARIPSVSLLGRRPLLRHLWSSGYDVSLTR